MKRTVNRSGGWRPINWSRWATGLLGSISLRAWAACGALINRAAREGVSQTLVGGYGAQYLRRPKSKFGPRYCLSLAADDDRSRAEEGRLVVLAGDAWRRSFIRGATILTVADRDFADRAAFFSETDGPLFAEIPPIAQAQLGNGD
jgi:hypothetical protein